MSPTVASVDIAAATAATMTASSCYCCCCLLLLLPLSLLLPPLQGGGKKESNFGKKRKKKYDSLRNDVHILNSLGLTKKLRKKRGTFRITPSVMGCTWLNAVHLPTFLTHPWTPGKFYLYITIYF